MKTAAGFATALAVVCAAGLSEGVASSSAAISRNMVVVSTTNDVVNGKVSSLLALKARPGRDGVSLREALMAANKTGGSATLYIMFSARLNGKIIHVRSDLPPIHRNHLVLEGVAPSGSPARVTLDGRSARLRIALLYVQASDVTVRWLRFTGVDARRHPMGRVNAVVVWPGRYMAAPVPPYPGRPSLVENVQIVDDMFDNSGIPVTPIPPHPMSKGLYVGTQGGGANTRIRGITIARNTFRNYGDDAVGVLETDPGATADGVAILNNTFERDAIPIELGLQSNATRITGTRIIGNTITGGINLDTVAVNGTIDQTLIEGNTISGLQGGILLNAAAPWDGPTTPAGDVISNTHIVNNVIHSIHGIGMEGGVKTSSPPSRVSGVTIQNNTLVNDQQPGTMFAALPNGPGASGNQITDVSIINSIFYEPSGNPIYVSSWPLINQAPDVVANSLISGPDWAGSNGNINGDPLFVDGPNGDYRLAAGSPAINAGTAVGAPGFDLEGARRDALPDIGAFEFGAVRRPLLTVMAVQLGGGGRVTSGPAGINCGTTCSARFDLGATVTLTARAARGSRFLGWTHGCSGVARCTVKLSSAKSVIARFAPPISR